jgi:hypothetical protein
MVDPCRCELPLIVKTLAAPGARLARRTSARQSSLAALQPLGSRCQFKHPIKPPSDASYTDAALRASCAPTSGARTYLRVTTPPKRLDPVPGLTSLQPSLDAFRVYQVELRTLSDLHVDLHIERGGIELGIPEPNLDLNGTIELSRRYRQHRIGPGAASSSRATSSGAQDHRDFLIN